MMKNTRRVMIYATTALFLCGMAAISGCTNSANTQPVIISDADSLAAIADDVSGTYSLANDIDMTGIDWTPIGFGSDAFSGYFYGNGHAVSNLTISEPESQYLGMFSMIEGGTVCDLVLEGVSITGRNYVGGIVGYLNPDSVVENCSVSGNVSAVYSAAGGIVGWNFLSDVRGCTNSAAVDGGNYRIGGIVGLNTGRLEDCCNSGTVSGLSAFGGIAGTNNGNISRTVNRIGITGSSTQEYGGIVGSNGAQATVSSSYYYSPDGSLYGSDYGMAVTEAGLKDRDTYVGWDFTDIWSIDETGLFNGGFPYLQ